MGHLENIWFLEPNFLKYDNQLLMWKIIYFLYILSHDSSLIRPIGLE